MYGSGRFGAQTLKLRIQTLSPSRPGRHYRPYQDRGLLPGSPACEVQEYTPSLGCSQSLHSTMDYEQRGEYDFILICRGSPEIRRHGGCWARDQSKKTCLNRDCNCSSSWSLFALPFEPCAVLRVGNVHLQAQSVHVGTWYIHGPQIRSHIPTSGPRYIPRTYVDELKVHEP